MKNNGYDLKYYLLKILSINMVQALISQNYEMAINGPWEKMKNIVQSERRLTFYLSVIYLCMLNFYGVNSNRDDINFPKS